MNTLTSIIDSALHGWDDPVSWPEYQEAGRLISEYVKRERPLKVVIDWCDSSLRCKWAIDALGQLPLHTLHLRNFYDDSTTYILHLLEDVADSLVELKVGEKAIASGIASGIAGKVRSLHFPKLRRYEQGGGLIDIHIFSKMPELRIFSFRTMFMLKPELLDVLWRYPRVALIIRARSWDVFPHEIEQVIQQIEKVDHPIHLYVTADYLESAKKLLAAIAVHNKKINTRNALAEYQRAESRLHHLPPEVFNAVLAYL